MPYSDFINDYICEFKEKQTKNEKLLYFKNLKKIASLALKSEYVAWSFCVVLALIYGFLNDNYGIQKLGTSNEAWII